nr:hypothetical protein [Tanacetum cinerariifolium]
MIIVGADNHPPMLEKSLYDSWKSQDGTTRTKKYEELSIVEKLQAYRDLKATNIILQGIVVHEFSQEDDLISCLNKAMDYLIVVASSRQGWLNVIIVKVKVTWLGNALSQRGQETLHGLRKRQCWLKHENLTEDLDAYDSDCDDVTNAKVVLMANVSNYGSDVISEKAQRIKPTLYDGSVISSQHADSHVIDDEETLIMEEDVLLSVMISTTLNGESVNLKHCDSLIAQLNSKSMENVDLKGQIQEKVYVTTSNELRRLKGKLVLDNANTIAPGMFKLDIEPISHRVKNNRDAHKDYLKKTIDNTDTIRGLVERARKQNLSELLLDSSYKFTNHVQKLLVYVSQTCPSFTKTSEKVVAVTSMNKVKKVRFSEPLTSSSNIYKQVESSKTPDSNTPVLPSTRLKSSTSASRS